MTHSRAPVWREVQPLVESTPDVAAKVSTGWKLRFYEVKDLVVNDDQGLALSNEVVGLMPSDRTVEYKNGILIVRAQPAELNAVTKHLEAKRRAAPPVLVK